MSVHTFEAMGTVVSIRLAGVEDSAASETAVQQAVMDAQAVFSALDKRFSLYRADSELSRIARGELSLAESSVEMREAYADALEWRARTNGDFTPHRPDGVIDLNGTIKAVAIARAGDAVRGAGFDNFSVNCGGDVLVSGTGTGTWPTGIVDPADRSQLLSVVNLSNSWCAIATSSVAERGEHIWSRPHTETVSADNTSVFETDAIYAQVTVVAHDIVTADVLATAIMSGGRRALDHAVTQFEVGVLAVTRDGELVGNSLFRELVAR